MPSLAVIGSGIMGRNHVRTARAVRSGEDVTVVDFDESRAREVAKSNGFDWAPSLDDVVDRVDAAIVAVPATSMRKSWRLCSIEGYIPCWKGR